MQRAMQRTTTRDLGTGVPSGATVLAATRGNDRSAFAALAERYRRQLHVHCYRMLGSVDDADDVVQETFLNAWRARGGFEGRSTFRTWLYRIATNACLRALQRTPRRRMPQDVVEPVTVDSDWSDPPSEAPPGPDIRGYSRIPTTSWSRPVRRMRNPRRWSSRERRSGSRT